MAMDTRMAVIGLLEASIAIPDAAKLDILKKLPVLSNTQVDALYGFLTAEKAFVAEHRDAITQNVEQLLSSLGN